MKIQFGIAIVIMSLGALSVHGGDVVPMNCLSEFLDSVDAIETEEGTRLVFYGGEGGRIHRLEEQDGEFTDVNEVGVPAAVRALAAADLDANGELELVVVTSDGQLAIHDGNSLEAIWRNQDERFASVEVLRVANVDQDPPLEILVLADSKLVIYDGSTRFKEWESPDETSATDLLVADVDGDEEDEIVLSTGNVLSTVFFQTEWEAGESFGQDLFLIDIDSDGIPEIAGRQSYGGLRVFSVKRHEELW
jgi:hypothetical protein